MRASIVKSFTLIAIALFLTPIVSAQNVTPTVNTITKLYFQHVITERPDIVQSLPSFYSGFVNATYNSDSYIPGKNYELLGQYVEATNAMVENAHEPLYPIYYDTIKKNELTFVHSTNPAELMVAKGNGTFTIYWKYDERFSDISKLTYQVYRLKNVTTDITKNLWDQSWKDMAWEKIAAVQASNFAITSGKFLQYSDSGYSTSGNTCYLIKVMDGTSELSYSLPACKNFATEISPTNFHITHSDIVRTKKESFDDFYANNTYQIIINATNAQNGSFKKPQLVLYGNDSDPNKCFQVNKTQFAYCFQELSRFDMVPNDNGATLTITLKRPYLLAKGGKNSTRAWTEEPTFRIQAQDENGTVQTFPYDGGYLVMAENNKLSQRIWTGYPANPASNEWQSKMVSVLKGMKSKGYNAVFLDIWYSKLFDITAGGASFDAPAIEFDYSEKSKPGFIDPSMLALDKLGSAIKADPELKNFQLIGNTLNMDINSVRMLQTIDGGMFEACIHSGTEKMTGDMLVNTFSVIKSALSNNKKVICFSSFADNNAKGINPLDSEHRIYTLASFLLIAENKTFGNTYYGNAPFPYSWGKDINQLPEYMIDLGNPVSEQETLEKYLWKRVFDNGVIYVNADSTIKSFVTTKKFNAVSIEGASVTRNSSSEITSANHGTIQYNSFPAGNHTLSSGTAVILINPSSMPGDINNDGKVDIFDYNALVAAFGNPYTIFDYNQLVANFGKSL